MELAIALSYGGIILSLSMIFVSLFANKYHKPRLGDTMTTAFVIPGIFIFIGSVYYLLLVSGVVVE